MTTDADEPVDQESPEQDAAFDEEAAKPGLESDGAVKLPDDDEKKDKKSEKPAPSKAKEPEENDDNKEDKEDKPADKKEESESGEEDIPKTAAEKAEAAAKSLEEGNGDDRPESVLDILPDSYAWARDVVGTDKFKSFVLKQPKAVQKAATSGDLDDSMYVLDLYKAAQDGNSEVKPLSSEAKATVSSIAKKFGDTKFTAPDGSEKTIKQIAAEYGNEELLEAIGAMAQAMNAESLKNMKPVEKNETVDKLQARIDSMAAEQAYWEEVLDAHPDAKRLAKKGKIGEWVKTQSPSVQRLYRSNNPEHSILVIDAYKESVAKAVETEADENSKGKKRNIDSLHSESLTGKKVVKHSKSGKTPEEEEDDGFNEGAK